jgi:Na+-transporting methylmalonyl-CoA/oxaloacetate decarboxylase gamma subunit
MAERAVGDIIKDMTDDVKLLVRDQVELAKTELVPSAKKAGIGGGLFGAAGYFALSALGILYFAAAFGLVAAGLSQWLAFLIVGVVLFLIAVVLGGIGYATVRKVKPPERSVAQANKTVTELKIATQQALAAARAPEIEGTVVDQRALR